MALQDDVNRLTAIQVRLLVMSGEIRRLRLLAKLSASALGKAAGVTADTIDSWERGISEPTTAQALALLDTVTRNAPRTQAMGLADVRAS